MTLQKLTYEKKTMRTTHTIVVKKEFFIFSFLKTKYMLMNRIKKGDL